MSEEDPDKTLPLSRWVKAKVVSDEPEPMKPTLEPAAGDGTPADAEPDVHPPIPPITDEELRAARWFSIAFLLVVIPLGLVVLSLVVWAFVSNIPWQ
jgi:hypothetical protein